MVLGESARFPVSNRILNIGFGWYGAFDAGFLVDGVDEHRVFEDVLTFGFVERYASLVRCACSFCFWLLFPYFPSRHCFAASLSLSLSVCVSLCMRERYGRCSVITVTDLGVGLYLNRPGVQYGLDWAFQGLIISLKMGNLLVPEILFDNAV